MARFTAVKIGPTVRENEWTDDVKEMVTAADADPEFGAEITVPIKEEGKTLADIRSAAKELGKTVRIRKRDDSAVIKVGTKENGKGIFEGDVTLTISFPEKYKDGRGRPKGSVNGAGNSTPVESEPAPVESEPAPVESEPAPVESEPAPVESEPAPVEVASKSK